MNMEENLNVTTTKFGSRIRDVPTYSGGYECTKKALHATPEHNLNSDEVALKLADEKIIFSVCQYNVYDLNP